MSRSSNVSPKEFAQALSDLIRAAKIVLAIGGRKLGPADWIAFHMAIDRAEKLK